MKRGTFLSCPATLALLFLTIIPGASAFAATEQVVHTFRAFGHGGNPQTSLVADTAGNLYGAASTGGAVNGGVVFKLTPTASGQWKETILHEFTGGRDGFQPMSGLVFDKAGNFYGTTLIGGDESCTGACGPGIVFEFSPNTNGTWTGKKIYTFQGNSDGLGPQGNLVIDSAGNLYGTTVWGGSNYSYGTVFELSPTGQGKWKEAILYSFTGKSDGLDPAAGVILDAAGNLYGTTFGADQGIGCPANCGTVFKLSPSTSGQWSEKTLYSFTGGNDGSNPSAGLTFDAAGNLYGTTISGGAAFEGVVFELTPSSGGNWTDKTLYSFDFTAVGEGAPSGGVVFDGAGNLYGVTQYGTNDVVFCSEGCGTVFELSPSFDGWTATTLYEFTGYLDGAYPAAGLVFDAASSLYGTTVTGAGTNCTWIPRFSDGLPAGCGTVFKLAPTLGGKWTESLLYTFPGTDGNFPNYLTSDAAGNLYGTTWFGGAYGYGEVFKLILSNGKWVPNTLYSFTGGTDGAAPNSVIVDAAGSLYGMAAGGGSPVYDPFVCGVVFKLKRTTSGEWKETVLHTFPIGTGADGCSPVGNLVFDAAGNLYGATVFGGGGSCPQTGNGCGVIFKLAPTGNDTWTETILHRFPASPNDGLIPQGTLVFDAEGNLYGTLQNSTVNCNPSTHCGMIFEMSPNSSGGWTENVLYNFLGPGSGGSVPNGGLIFDATGNLYGTAQLGGQTSSYSWGCGNVFELSPKAGAWALQVLYTFAGYKDGCMPMAGLIFDTSGNLYGSALFGGSFPGLRGNGTVFELSPSAGSWNLNTLYTFTGAGDGGSPDGGVVFGAAGKLYGTTECGGASFNSRPPYCNPGQGVVFEITP